MSTLKKALCDPANFPTLAEDLRFYSGLNEADMAELLQFASTVKREVVLRSDCVTDFMGVSMRTWFIKGHEALGGCQEGLPYPSNFHAEAIEWSGLAKALARADRSREFVAVELGAGWGPWLVAAHHGAKAFGFEKVLLVGVEGDAGHYDFMLQHFKDNGIDPEKHDLTIGIVGTKDGIAHFPAVDDPSSIWGAKAEYHKTSESSAAYLGMPHDWAEVPCFSLEGILRPHDHVDLLHCDIQGHEFEVLSSCFDVLKKKVRTMVIGTHSRLIEGQLLDALLSRGWMLAGEKPCKFHLAGGRPCLYLDGTQVWLNDG